MMTREQVMELLASAGEDLSVYERADGVIRVDVQDFDGFDEDYCEIDRDYDEELVDSIFEQLASEAISVEEDFFDYYQFEGFVVMVGYASFDI